MKKTYLKRDGATAALKKAGVAREDYDKHLTKVAGGFEATLPDLPGKAATPKAKAGKTPAKAAKAPRVTCASTVRELIKQGKTNEQIWAVIKPKFQLKDEQKHYPSWYRSQAKRAKAGA